MGNFISAGSIGRRDSPRQLRIEPRANAERVERQDTYRRSLITLGTGREGKMKRRFLAGGVLLFLVLLASQVYASALYVDSSPYYVTTDDPANHIVLSTDVPNFDEVGQIDIAGPSFGVLGTGTLLNTNQHILTAAHLWYSLAEGYDLRGLAPSATTIRFDDEAGPISVQADAIDLHPGYDGDTLRGNDVAVITLSSPIDPTRVSGRSIDTNGADDVGAVGQKVGYGRSGQGNTGDTIPSGLPGTKREGENKYDALGDALMSFLGLSYVPGSVLGYDFDNGLAANDGYGWWFGLPDPLGRGDDEVMSAPGDSGGPTFNAGGEIMGITSYGLTFVANDLMGNPSTTDIDGLPTPAGNSSFGEFGGDARVSFYSDWINSIVDTQVPEPATMLLVGTGLLGLAVFSRRFKK
jgi:hypothetical protein